MDALKELEEIVNVQNHQYNREGIYDNSIGYNFEPEFRYTRDNLSTITEESDSKIKFNFRNRYKRLNTEILVIILKFNESNDININLYKNESTINNTNNDLLENNLIEK